MHKISTIQLINNKITMANKVTVKSWETINLTPEELAIRNKNLWTPWTQTNPISTSPDIASLESKIKTWDFTAKEALAYNLATKNQQWARQVALWSPEAVQWTSFKTAITPEEAQTMKSQWIWQVNTKNITADTTQKTTDKQGFDTNIQKMQDQAVWQPLWVEKTTVETPEWTTTTTKETPTETKPITAETQWKDTDKSLWTLEQMVESRYWTVATQNPDWTLSAIIGDKKYQWEITPEWPRKTEVQLTQAEQIKMKAISKYMTASADELYSAMINGNITKEMEQSLMANPNYAIAKEKQSKKLSTDNINSQMEWVYNSMTWKTTKEDTTIEDMSNKTTTDLTNKWIDVPKFSEYIAKDETLSADVISLNSQIKTIRELKDTAEANTKRIIEEYPWISKASAILLSARQNEPLYEQIKALSYDATELQANINYRQWILEEDYKAELAQYQLQEQRAYQEQLTAETRAYNEQQAITNLENQYKYTYWDLDSTNPTLQNIAIKNALTDMYTKYQDIPWLESMAIKEQKIQNLISQGMTWSQAIAQVENEIRSSERYKNFIANKQSELQPDTNYWVVWKDAQGNDIYWFVDTKTKTITPYTPWATSWDLRWLAGQFPWQAWAKNNNPAWITWNSNFDKWIGTAKLLADAWIQFSKWTARPSNEWWNYVTFNTIEDWLKAQQIMMTWTYWNSTVNQMLQKWVWTANWPAYAKSVAGNAWIDLNKKVSDLTPDELSMLQMAKIQRESPWLYNLLTQWWWEVERVDYTDDDIAVLSSVTKLDKQWKETLKENWYTEKEWARFNAWLLPPTTRQKTDANVIVNKVDDILSWDWTDAVWTLKSRVFTWAWTDRKVTELKVNALKDLLAMANLDKIKWAMSDKDIEFLRNTATYLSTDLSEIEFEKTLKQIRDKYAWISTGTPITTTTTQTWNTTWWWQINIPAKDPLGLFSK